MTIAEALRAAARYVEEHKATLAWNGPEMPSDEEKARVVAEVSVLGYELDSLAAARAVAVQAGSWAS